MGLPAQLVLRDLDCRQQLQFGREQRSFLLVRGPAGAQVSKFSAVVMLATNVSKYGFSFTAMFDIDVVTFFQT